MKKTNLLNLLTRRVTILAALLVATAVVSFVVVPAAQVDASCTCGPDLTTDTLSADGPTCNAAIANLNAALEAEAHCLQDYCYTQTTLTMGCTWNGSGYWVMGYLEYSCERCIPTGP